MIQGKLRYMRVTKASFAVSAMAIVFALAGPSFAQDTLPETPPELRDFRLDPERQQPQSEPTAQPTVAPPPVVSTVPERPTAQPRPQPQRAAPATQAIPTDVEPATPDSLPETTVPDTAPPQSATETPTEAAPEAEPTTEPASSTTPVWQIVAGIGLLAILLFGVYALVRRRRAATPADANYIEPVDKSAPVRLAKKPLPAPPVPAFIPKPATPKPRIVLDFIPEKATVSFTALSVKGQLRLINEGDAQATAMELRAGLMSASAGQEQRIAEFHQAGDRIKGEPIGDAKAGERIAMAIELSVPLADMESFTVGDQRLLVPIMIANLSFRIDGEDRTETAKISCMIGREASPPTPKMAPLRLDLGPRSFASLGQRPVYA